MSRFIKDPKKYFNSLPKKPIGAGVLFFNKKNELLLVKPSYKDYWSIPGGVVNKSESPKKTAEREVEEEIGLKIKVNRLISVDHATHSKYGKGVDSIQFLFYGGNLNDKQINKIKIDNQEIEEYRFINVKKIFPLLGNNLRKRLKSSLIGLKNKKIVYLEKGKIY